MCRHAEGGWRLEVDKLPEEHLCPMLLLAVVLRFLLLGLAQPVMWMLVMMRRRGATNHHQQCQYDRRCCRGRGRRQVQKTQPRHVLAM